MFKNAIKLKRKKTKKNNQMKPPNKKLDKKMNKQLIVNHREPND